MTSLTGQAVHDGQGLGSTCAMRVCRTATYMIVLRTKPRCAPSPRHPDPSLPSLLRFPMLYVLHWRPFSHAVRSPAPPAPVPKHPLPENLPREPTTLLDGGGNLPRGRMSLRSPLTSGSRWPCSAGVGSERIPRINVVTMMETTFPSEPGAEKIEQD